MRNIMVILLILYSIVLISQTQKGLFLSSIFDNNVISAEFGGIIFKEYRNINTGFGTIPLLELGIEGGLLVNSMGFITNRTPKRGYIIYDGLNLFAKPYIEVQMIKNISATLRLETLNWSSFGAGIIIFKKNIKNINLNLGWMYDTTDNFRLSFQIIYNL